jgi:peptide/nickel transport system substrate-binding protein/oligopeptide transport system substrate-binding protein
MKRYKFVPFITIFILVVPVLFNNLCQNSLAETKEREVPVEGGNYRRPLEFMPRTLDPALVADIYSVSIIQQLFDGLVQFDQNLNIIPAIAKSWEISRDGLIYTFYLKEGIKFHNRREVTAEDFVYSFSRIINPKTRSPAAHFLEKVLGVKEFQEGKTNYIEGIRSVGKYNFQIKLSEPFSPFISVLGIVNFKVVPKEEIEKPDTVFPISPVGTGPFKFVSTKEQREIILEANSDYFEGRPYLDKIIFKIFHGSPREEISMHFKQAELEESLIPFRDVEEITKSKQYIFVQKPILSLRFYGLNTQSEPLRMEKIRRAISYSIPRELIGRDILKGMAHLTDRIIPIGMPGYTPGKVSLGYQPHRAKALLREVGFPGGRGLPSIDFWSAAKAELAVKELEMVKNHLYQSGININIRYETQWPKFQEILSSKEAPMFMYAWYADFPDPDNFIGTLFHSKSRSNYTNYHNPEVDHLLDLARIERDYLKRMEMYRKIEEIILDDAPIVPMVNHLFQMVYQPYVRGVEVSSLGGPYIPMRKIWLKKD